METIDILYRSGFFEDMDYHFSRFISRLAGSDDFEIRLAAALVSHVTANGNVCLELRQWAGTLLLQKTEKTDIVSCPDLDSWREKLSTCSAVGRPTEFAPLILDQGDRLYLYRYWEYESKLSQDLIRRMQTHSHGVDRKRLRKSMEKFFPESSEIMLKEQRLAAAVTLLNPLSIIAGGPGTGKTTAIGRIIAILVDQKFSSVPRIVLSAPTGKAAVRLAESIKSIKQEMVKTSDLGEVLPEATTTIHRLLQPISGSPYFRYHSENLLPVDIIIVDEASMVDLALMAKLMDALPKDARIILVGDKDQLASVEAGSVLGDICDRNSSHLYSPEFSNHVEATLGLKITDELTSPIGNTGLQDHIAHLNVSYRFSGSEPIKTFSQAVNAGDDQAALSILTNGSEKQVGWKRITSRSRLFVAVKHLASRFFSDYIRATDPLAALNQLNRFQILCVVKKGDFGVQGINRMLENILFDQKLIFPDTKGERWGNERWYQGKPILITRNDYRLNLFNGDLGVTFHDPMDDRNKLAVFFPSSDGSVRRFSIHQLPEFETAFAITVHKSQGSEFDEVVLLLPQSDTPVLTRELLYTGATRARRNLSIWGVEEIFRGAVKRKIARSSGLRDALWQGQYG